MRDCRLVGLRDLDHSKADTRNKVAAYLNDLIDLGVAGFRVDAAKHMWPEDLSQIYSMLHDLPIASGFPENTKAWIGQEVIGKATWKNEYKGLGAVTEFWYMYRLMDRQDSLVDFRTMIDDTKPFGKYLKDKEAFVFATNHDKQRGDHNIASFENPRALRIATAMLMALPYGTKRIMSSYIFTFFDQGPPDLQPGTDDMESGTCTNEWVCEHRWPGIRNLAMLSGAMNRPTSETIWQWDNGASQLSFTSGDGFFAINNDDTTLEQDLQTALPAGLYCNLALDDFEGCTETLVVKQDGTAFISIPSGADIPFVYTTLDAKIVQTTTPTSTLVCTCPHFNMFCDDGFESVIVGVLPGACGCIDRECGKLFTTLVICNF